MIKEYYRLMVLQSECSQTGEDLQNQISSLRSKMAEKYQQGRDDDVVVKEGGQYYIIYNYGSIRKINFVESQDE